MTSRPQFETQADALLREQFMRGDSSAGLNRPVGASSPISPRGTIQPFAGNRLFNQRLQGGEMQRLIQALIARGRRRQLPQVSFSDIFRRSISK